MKCSYFIIKFVVLSLLVIVGLSCIIGSALTQTYTPQPTPPPLQNPTITHRYILSVVGSDGSPIANAKIAYSSRDRYHDWNTTEIEITNHEGKATILVTATPDPEYRYTKSYLTELKYEIEKDGYYSLSGAISSFKTYSCDEEENITLFKSPSTVLSQSIMMGSWEDSDPYAGSIIAIYKKEDGFYLISKNKKE